MQTFNKLSVFHMLIFLSVAVRAEVAGEKLMIGSFSSGSLDKTGKLRNLKARQAIN